MRTLPLAMMLLSAAAISADSIAAEVVDKQQQWQTGTPIEIDVPRGELTLTGSDSDRVSVTGTLDDQTTQFVFEQQEKRLLIKVELPKNWGNNQDNNLQRSDLNITLPAAAMVSVAAVSTDISAKTLNHLDIDAVSSDIELDQGNGSFNINIVSGEIRSSALEGKVALQTVSGDIDASNNLGQLRLSSVSGDIKAHDLQGDLSLESVSGDIELSIDQIQDLNGRVVSGDIDVTSGSVAEQGKIALESVSGDITIAVKNIAEVQVRAQTGGGGDIDNNWSKMRPQKGKYGGGSSLQFGQRGATVQLNTVSGDIELLQR